MNHGGTAPCPAALDALGTSSSWPTCCPEMMQLGRVSEEIQSTPMFSRSSEFILQSQGPPNTAKSSCLDPGWAFPQP